MSIKRIKQAAAALVFALQGAAPVQAASSQLCRQLEADLASASRATQSASQTRRFDRAIEAQERQLAIAENQWQRAGCAYGPPDGTDRLCLSIEDTLARMEGNYRDLRQERSRLDSRASARVERQRIQREMEDAGCNDTPPPPQEAGLPRADQPVHNETRLRTMCVRTCDGYFFPLSYGVARTEFDRDAKACQATCPSTEMKLYFHKVPEEEASAMVSADTGEPYASLPTANRYRGQNTAQPGACGCASAGQQGTVASTSPQQSTPDAGVESPSIQVLPDQSLPSQQTAVAPSGDDAKPSVVEQPKAAPQPAQNPAPPPEPGPARAMSPDQKKVRVVGPTFLPDQEEAIDLRVPGRTGAR